MRSRCTTVPLHLWKLLRRELRIHNAYYAVALPKRRIVFNLEIGRGAIDCVYSIGGRLPMVPLH